MATYQALTVALAERLLDQLPGNRPFLFHSARVAAYAQRVCARRGQTADTDVLRWAGTFHDIMVLLPFRLRPWGADYVSDSAELAGVYLTAKGLLDPARIQLVQACIQHHHDLRTHPHPLVEAFRLADWLEVSQGLMRAGLTATDMAEVRGIHPPAGFGQALAGVILRVMNPIRPIHGFRLFWPVRRYPTP
ncbi:MAG: HD domain-containing protein [Candidatus Sericytochromatia bacterium]|nr:HD domain-containing protein [Candidatus Sericytochromatia bacterium]